jgi:hypothetical protein
MAAVGYSNYVAGLNNIKTQMFQILNKSASAPRFFVGHSFVSHRT